MTTQTTPYASEHPEQPQHDQKAERHAQKPQNDRHWSLPSGWIGEATRACYYGSIVAADERSSPHRNFPHNRGFALRLCAISRQKSSAHRAARGGDPMHGIIYLIGLIVVIMAILSFFGLR